MTIKKGDKFKFYLVDKKNCNNVVYEDDTIYDDWEECQREAYIKAVETNTY